jgi:hypothetical protein
VNLGASSQAQSFPFRKAWAANPVELFGCLAAKPARNSATIIHALESQKFGRIVKVNDA